ncbi:MAG TPA: HD domain-containing phosphohydrolase, partial [Patescibacteria group bacterium]|nr:HD domain-containing phosphohydrolase [Patescibacteria group bacterium]
MEDEQDQIEMLSNELVKSFLSTIDILSALVSSQERFYEGSHCHFVAEKSAIVARSLGLNESEIFEIETAALLHDIGKIGYSDVLLSKFPNEMTGHEFDLYTRHAELGKRLLEMHSGFETISEIVYQHHERIDGSGFPQHLKGDRIHIGASIIGVVDFYHNVLYRRKRDRLQHTENSSAPANAANFLQSTQSRYAQAINHLKQKSGSL